MALLGLSAPDYSQVELRTSARLLGDPDLHVAAASEMFEVDAAAVTPDQRRAAKASRFGLMYGLRRL